MCRRCPGGHSATAGALEKEDDVIFGRCCQSGEGCHSSSCVGIGQVKGDTLAAGGGCGLDVGHILEIGNFVGPDQGNGLGTLAGDLQEQVVLDGVGLEGIAVVYGHLAVVKFGRLGGYAEGILAVGLEIGLEGNFTSRKRLGKNHSVGFGVKHLQQIFLCIGGDIPAEGGGHARIGIHACGEVHRLKATLQRNILQLVEYLVLNATGSNDCDERNQDIFNLIHSSSRLQVCSRCC